MQNKVSTKVDSTLVLSSDSNGLSMMYEAAIDRYASCKCSKGKFQSLSFHPQAAGNSG